MKRNFSFWTRLNDFPPLVCRLLARLVDDAGCVRAIPVGELSRKSGLHPTEINSLSCLTSWDTIPVGVMKRFTFACGIDFSNRDNMRKHSGYLLRQPTFKYLRKDPAWRSTYEPLVRTYLTFTS